MNPGVPPFLNNFRFPDLWLGNDLFKITNLEWSRAVLNSEWFPKQVEILPICSNANAAYPRIWLSLFYSSDPNSQTSNWLEAAEYILCKFIEHGLRIHQHQPCFPGKAANHRKDSESLKEEVFMKLYCYYYKCCGCSKLSKYLSANLSLTLPTTDLTSIHVLETQKPNNLLIMWCWIWWR